MSFPENLPLEDVFASIADGLFTVDVDWNVTYFNESAERITGIRAEEALGHKCWDVFRSSLCDGQCAIDECVRKGGRIVNKSIFIIKSDGTKLPVSISASPLRNGNGEVVGGVETFRDLTEIHVMRRKVRDLYSFEDIVGRSEGLDKIFRILPQVSQSTATVLVLGQSGTGKELFARAIHNLSPRKEKPFVAVNCGALPDTLLESELFGYRAGAFTDARTDKPGRLEMAEGGTVFLDEIGDMAAPVQVKLLRFLQERTFEPLGGLETISADVRIVAATHQNLEAMVAAGTFRQDLYYRLNVVTLDLPALAERREDIPILIDHFVAEFNAVQGRAVEGVSEDVLHILMRHDFPGNVRELENILEYGFILCPSGFIQTEHLPEYLQAASRMTQGAGGLHGTMEEIKCRAASQALKRNHGRKMATCRELKISKDTLRRMLSRCPEDEE
ncbi:sigma-54 interaction domain-containing protein [Pseudodesulfovibrio piezophilus]|uniref:Putative sigma54 specific transcriptional regulator n=1 Tax=Pseudodesulfovibrio piezophilus (strain DSM 21447 / JCM 15486 / C1TLV30) TaxID=1322246 RepID=M1WMW0_PSEP2|nr:sigma 54-interacting transcriptional regulator [Pseudodesulfovibrio piezophilus]CCH50005.1 putative sigma54 specific transcriptional regulator [Pseudodesulfovibrio piezophilus C1TLV30]